MATLADAIRLAVTAHDGQTQIDGRPYVLHPLHMMFMLEGDEDAMIVAVLHDVVEDTPVTLDDLRADGYAEHIIAAVEHVTRRDDESYEKFIARIKPHPLARKVKLADLRDNMDVLRLPEIRERDVERLRRYRAAWDVLMAEEAR
ncbi:MAG: HD domain-containing protein [Anaerolineae bacterium]|nr:HD domain-containing protein [Anaerolineae bacterium]